MYAIHDTVCICEWLARGIYHNRCEFHTVDPLCEAILTTWSNDPISFLEKLKKKLSNRQEQQGYSPFLMHFLLFKLFIYAIFTKLPTLLFVSCLCFLFLHLHVLLFLQECIQLL